MPALEVLLVERLYEGNIVVAVDVGDDTQNGVPDNRRHGIRVRNNDHSVGHARRDPHQCCLNKRPIALKQNR